MKTTINIPSNIRYLQEYLTDLPHNCIFDKGKTGAGGTSVALLNDEPYVIAVPFLSLIENKTAQHRSVLAIYSLFTHYFCRNIFISETTLYSYRNSL